MGRFVVIEGLDGAGTTTQAARLTAFLEGQGAAVVSTREPTDGRVGKQIRAVLTQEPGALPVASLPWLFAADRADHVFSKIQPALDRGAWVISDRYYHSSLAYQSLSWPLDDVWALNRHFLTPDVTFFVDIPVDVALERIESRIRQAALPFDGVGRAPAPVRRELFEVRDRLVAIRENYESTLDFLGERGHRIVRVDGTRTMDQVAQAICLGLGEIAP